MATPLEPRGDRHAPRVFKQGANAPYAIRWYGVTSLVGHFRAFVSTAIARESVDTRDWMRPIDAPEMLARMTGVLGVANKGTLVESLDRPLWIDWIADTGDDLDVSQAVGRMLFSEYAVDDGGAPLTLPRGDVLLFGGDTAYPVATAEEIHRRVVRPWNELLRKIPADRDRPRVLLGIAGNHDWYDGLDGFGRFFRRDIERAEAPPESLGQAQERGRNVGLAVRGLHLDEVEGAIEMIADAAKTTSAIWSGESIARRRRLTLTGYEAVQDASYWALPLAPGFDLWGVDRQLGRIDFRQRTYFHRRRNVVGKDAGIWFVAPDPAIAFGESWEFGAEMLEACNLSMEHDRVLFQCGDMHQYERRIVGESLHVIAGGGGAFLHGTRIVPDPKPAASAYPNARTTRSLALQVPVRLLLGRAGYLVHLAGALVASIELAVGWHSWRRLLVMSLLVSTVITWMLYAIAGHRRAHPRRVLALSIPFGAALGMLPMGLSVVLHETAHFVPLLGRDSMIILFCAFVGALLYGIFLALCALGGLEMQQVFTVLGHPGFKHFVRMRIAPNGTVDAWVIGKDDPLGSEPARLIDRWTWNPRRP